MIYKLYLKRIIDFTIALIGLIILSPIILILILCIKVDSKGPVLFKQRRIEKRKGILYFKI